MGAFDEQSLWNKSKVLVDRALRARDDGDNTDFHLWAAVCLEILGKSVLAHIHPTLVADPSDFGSLLTAAGQPTGTNHRSITAKTVFERLGTAIPDFDERMKRECMLMANRRNAELHSGETPIVGLDVRSWVPPFWRAANVLLKDAGRSLEEWVGGTEGTRVKAILADAAELLRQTVLARIERRRNDWNERYPQDSTERREAESRASARPFPARLVQSADGFEDATCPACRQKAWLSGFIGDEEIVRVEADPDPDWGPGFYEISRITYDVEGLHCPECGLVLEGRDEIAIAGLSPDFVRDDEREPDYEPDYGND